MLLAEKKQKSHLTAKYLWKHRKH